MAFGAAQRARLLAAKGVGPTVIARLERLGFTSLQQLGRARAQDITAQVAAMLGSPCWRNSPQAAAAIQAARGAPKA